MFIFLLIWIQARTTRTSRGVWFKINLFFIDSEFNHVELCITTIYLWSASLLNTHHVSPHSGSISSECWGQCGCCNHAPWLVNMINTLWILTIRTGWSERSRTVSVGGSLSIIQASACRQLADREWGVQGILGRAGLGKHGYGKYARFCVQLPPPPPTTTTTTTTFLLIVCLSNWCSFTL